MAAGHISRKEFLKMLGGSALLSGIGGAQGLSAAAADRPNVIFILSDDQAVGELGLLNPGLQTPNLDRLARSGVRFANTFVNTSICAPGRACVLTGLYSRRNGVIDNHLMPRRSDSLLPRLQQSGYVTGMAGKLHWPIFPDPSEFGFDWQGAVVPSAMLFAHPIFGYYGRDQKPARLTKEEGDTVITDAALSFVEANKDRPFFLWLAYFSAHAPMLMPRKFREMYKPADMKLPPNYAPAPEGTGLKATTGGTPSAYGGPIPGGPDELKKSLALYRGMISYMDEQIGRLLDRVQRLGLARKTMIVFMTDNGFMLGNHGYGGKGLMYEESIKLPLIISWPEKFKPAVVDELACITDILPTVMDTAGISVPSGLAGRSLLPLLQGKRTPVRDEIFCELYPRKWKAVRTREWKYISTPELGEELYRIVDDPYEMKNLAAERQHRAVLEKLRTDWSRWERETGEPGPGQEPQENYVEAITRERGRLVRLIQENDYDPELAMGIGRYALFAWLDVLKSENKFSSALKSLVESLLKTNYDEQVNSPAVRATMSEFLKELVRCDLAK